MGVTAAGLTASGTGFIRAPVVTVSGGGGTGATASATIDTSGNLTGIVITNPGVGYTSAPTFTLSGGGSSISGSVTGTATLVDNTLSNGGLTKQGPGRLTINAVQGYTGPTTVTAGTLLLGASGNITTSGAVNIFGVGAKFVQGSSTALVPTVTVTNGTLDGTGTVNNAVVPDGTGGTVSNGSNGIVNVASPLTITTLTLNGAGTLNPVTSGAVVNTTASALVLGTLNTNTTNHSATITISPVNTSGGWTNGTYHLASYSTLNTNTVLFNSAFTLNLTGLGGRQTKALTNPAGFIDLVIGGDRAVWSGALALAPPGNWTVTPQASPKNWVLSSTLAQTDYEVTAGQGDAVLFDDTATGTTQVNIADATVSPALITVNNTLKPYVISSTSGGVIAGSGGIIDTGSGSLTLNTANTFSGGVAMNGGGTLNIGIGTVNNGVSATPAASAIGTGRLTLNHGAIIDNTSGTALTLGNVTGGSPSFSQPGTNNLLTLNGDFTFLGSNGANSNLNLGTGRRDDQPRFRAGKRRSRHNHDSQRRQHPNRRRFDHRGGSWDSKRRSWHTGAWWGQYDWWQHRREQRHTAALRDEYNIRQYPCGSDFELWRIVEDRGVDDDQRHRTEHWFRVFPRLEFVCHCDRWHRHDTRRDLVGERLEFVRCIHDARWYRQRGRHFRNCPPNGRQ